MTPAPDEVAVRLADIQAIEAAVRSAHRALLEHTEAVTAASRLGLADWSESTDSRQAQLTFERDLTHRVELLTRALARIADEVSVTSERAHDTETRALAALD